MDGIAISICPSRYPRFEVLRCLDLVDLAVATGWASGTPGSAPGAGASLSPRVPVLRLNFMSKCYLIGCRLQQRVADRVMHRSCHNYRRCDAKRICVPFTSVSRGGAGSNICPLTMN